MALELIPAKAEPSAPTGSLHLGRWLQRLTAQDRIAFTERLALLLETGTSLHISLEALARQAGKPAMRELLQDLGEQIAAGKSFSYALARHPRLFDATYVNLIGAGEQAGFLPEALQQLQRFDERREHLQTTLVSALTYPLFLILFSVAVVGVVLVVVFPKFADMFASIHDQLPLSTLVLLKLSELLRTYWPLVIAAVTATVVAGGAWSRSTTGRQFWDHFVLSAPGIRTIVVPLYVLNIFRVMSLSLTNGVSVIAAFDACRDVVNNSVFRRFLDATKEQVLEGRGIAKAFNEARFIPPSVKQMISTGEQAGKLPQVMAKTADFYERDLERKINLLAKIAEPVMLLIMGLVVGTIVSSLILPIFKLSRAVH